MKLAPDVPRVHFLGFDEQIALNWFEVAGPQHPTVYGKKTVDT